MFKPGRLLPCTCAFEKLVVDACSLEDTMVDTMLARLGLADVPCKVGRLHCKEDFRSAQEGLWGGVKSQRIAHTRGCEMPLSTQRYSMTGPWAS